jgi:hypothetical protein
MATMDTYGVRFIGNDMVAPRVRRTVGVQSVQRQHNVTEVRHVPRVRAPHVRPMRPASPAQQPAARPIAHEDTYSEGPVVHSEVFGAQMNAAVVSKKQTRKRHAPTLSRKTVIFSVAVLLVVGALAYGVPHASALKHTVSIESSRLNARLHPNVQPSFTMPAHSVLVKTSISSNYMDAVESQNIELDIGSNVVTPLPNDIAGWIKTSNGPEKNTTLLTVNTAAITSYLTIEAQKSGSFANGIDSAAMSDATNKIANTLLKYNGVTVSIPSGTDNSQ